MSKKAHALSELYISTLPLLNPVPQVAYQLGFALKNDPRGTMGAQAARTCFAHHYFRVSFPSRISDFGSLGVWGPKFIRNWIGAQPLGKEVFAASSRV